jgi:hypothetical protein
MKWKHNIPKLIVHSKISTNREIYNSKSLHQKKKRKISSKQPNDSLHESRKVKTSQIPN